MSNKLDERYVEYDLDNAISILPIKNGGTGSNVITASRVMISHPTGGAVPFETVVKASDITVENLGALQGISAASTIETRIGNIENNHVGGVGSKIHVPTSGASNQYLKSVNGGNPVWQSGILPTTTGADITKYLRGDNSWQPTADIIPNINIVAWVKFNATGVIYSSGAFNVSSVTHLSTGNYRVNFVSSISGHYCAVCSTNGITIANVTQHTHLNLGAMTSTYCDVYHYAGGDTATRYNSGSINTLIIVQ